MAKPHSASLRLVVVVRWLVFSSLRHCNYSRNGTVRGHANRGRGSGPCSRMASSSLIIQFTDRSAGKGGCEECLMGGTLLTAHGASSDPGNPHVHSREFVGRSRPESIIHGMMVDVSCAALGRLAQEPPTCSKQPGRAVHSPMA